MLKSTSPHYEAQLTARERLEASIDQYDQYDDSNESLQHVEEICEILNPSLETIQSSNKKELNTWFVDRIPSTDLYTIRFNGIFSSPAKLAELKKEYGSNLIEDPNGFHELKI